MTTPTALARTARKAHDCATCDGYIGPDDEPSIQPGHRYLIHVVFPGADGHEEGTRPWRAKECIACAEEREAMELSRGLALACATYCCGTTPCALPFERGAPDHQHSCRDCARDRARVGAIR